MVTQRLDNRAPQHKAGRRPNVPATFAALDDEPAHAFLKIVHQQAGRRRMCKRWNALGFEIQNLVDPTARNDREIWPDPVNRFDLRLEDLGVGEPKNSDPPRPAAQKIAGFGQQFFRTFTAQQRQRGKGQRPGPGDAHEKVRDIADACHRSLKNRVSSPKRRCEWRAFSQNGATGSLFRQGFCSGANRTDKAAKRSIACSHRLCQCQRLPSRCDIARSP